MAAELAERRMFNPRVYDRSGTYWPPMNSHDASSVKYTLGLNKKYDLTSLVYFYLCCSATLRCIKIDQRPYKLLICNGRAGSELLKKYAAGLAKKCVLYSQIMKLIILTEIKNKPLAATDCIEGPCNSSDSNQKHTARRLQLRNLFFFICLPDIHQIKTQP
jgi:hypothetical protein